MLIIEGESEEKLAAALETVCSLAVAWAEEYGFSRYHQETAIEAFAAVKLLRPDLVPAPPIESTKDPEG